MKSIESVCNQFGLCNYFVFNPKDSKIIFFNDGNVLIFEFLNAAFIKFQVMATFAESVICRIRHCKTLFLWKMCM